MTAKDKATGKEQKIRIEASSGLSDAEIDRMVKDAEKNAEADKKRREEIDTRNRLDSMTYEVEKNAKEWSDKLPADLKTKLDAAVERARKALRGDDMNEIRAAQEELSKAFGEAGQSFYAQNQGQPGEAPPAGGEPSGWTAGRWRRNNGCQAGRRRGGSGLRDRGRQEVTIEEAAASETSRAPYVSIWNTRRPSVCINNVVPTTNRLSQDR